MIDARKLTAGNIVPRLRKETLARRDGLRATAGELGEEAEILEGRLRVVRDARRSAVAELHVVERLARAFD